MSKAQIREMEAWGRSKDGYHGGGNYDENPNLKNYTLAKYQQMKDKG